MAAWRYEISLFVSKNISLVHFDTPEIFFNTRSEISFLREAMYYLPYNSLSPESVDFILETRLFFLARFGSLLQNCLHYFDQANTVQDKGRV